MQHLSLTSRITNNRSLELCLSRVGLASRWLPGEEMAVASSASAKSSAAAGFAFPCSLLSPLTIEGVHTQLFPGSPLLSLDRGPRQHTNISLPPLFISSFDRERQLFPCSLVSLFSPEREYNICTSLSPLSTTKEKAATHFVDVVFVQSAPIKRTFCTFWLHPP